MRAQPTPSEDFGTQTWIVSLIRLSHSQSVATKLAIWITGIPEIIDKDVEGLLVPPHLERNVGRLAKEFRVRLAT